MGTYCENPDCERIRCDCVPLAKVTNAIEDLDLKNKESIVNLLLEVQCGTTSCRRAATELINKIKPEPKKYLIIGHGGHGKDEVATLLGLQFQSSSDAALDIFIWEDWGKRNYLNKDRCYNDRVNNRQRWYELICEFNKEDKARLAKEILKDNEVYNGMRCKLELDECVKQGIFDCIIWVDATHRLPLEPSNKTSALDADFIIDNNGSKADLFKKVQRLKTFLNID